MVLLLSSLTFTLLADTAIKILNLKNPFLSNCVQVSCASLHNIFQYILFEMQLCTVIVGL